MVSHIYTSTYQQIREKKLIPLRDPLSSLANSTSSFKASFIPFISPLAKSIFIAANIFHAC